MASSRFLRRRTLVLSALLVAFALACSYPRYDIEDDDAMFRALDAVMQRDADSARSSSQSADFLRVPLMSFNLRYDNPEVNPSNDFSARLPRIVRLFSRVQPWIVGLQEAFVTQLRTLLTALPPHYKAVWNEPAEGAVPHERLDGANAILFDSRRLELVESDWVWLSEQPRVHASASWGSGMPRALNIALFRVRSGQPLAGTMLLHANTHLDVWSEWARREQSDMVARLMNEWQERYPTAVASVSADWNAVPGQVAYLNMARSMSDAWVECKANPAPLPIESASLAAASSRLNPGCVSNDVSHSFHAWVGTRLHSYVGRLAQGVGFTLHGLGLDTPHHVPRSWRKLWKMTRRFLSRPPRFSLWEAIPFWPWDRLHVDWIFYRQAKQIQQQQQRSQQSQTQESQLSAGGVTATPLFVALMDARTSNFSSDHFPLVAIFQLQRATAAASDQRNNAQRQTQAQRTHEGL